MVALLVWVGPSWGQNSGALQAASLASTCGACHGTAGVAVPDAVVPGLAAMPAADLRERMRAFKSGALQGTVMPQIAKGYSDAQIDRLAEYFAARPPR